MPIDDEIRAGFESERKQFKGVRIDDFKAGDWFASFVRWLLENYAHQVDAEYIQKKYPGAGPTNHSRKARTLACRYSALTGGLTASAITAAEASIPGSGGFDLPIAIPVIAAAVMADIALMTRIQLRTVYDLSVIHGAPLSVDDAEDCYFIFMLALGIRMEGVGGNAMKAIGPKVVQYNVRRLLRSGLRRSLVEVVKKIAGTEIAKKLTEKVMLGVLVPGINIPMSSGLNYAFTRHILSIADKRMKRRGAAIRPLKKFLAAEPQVPPAELLRALVVTLEAVPREGWPEGQLAVLRHSQSALMLSDDEVGTVEAAFDMRPADFIASLPTLSKEGCLALTEYLATAVSLGPRDHDAEQVEVIRAITSRNGLDFNSDFVRHLRKSG